jgi:hypothetical protein
MIHVYRAELRKMEGARVPRDKLICLLNCCHIVNSLIRTAQLKRGPVQISAHNFLPLLIYTVIKYESHPCEIYVRVLCELLQLKPCFDMTNKAMYTCVICIPQVTSAANIFASQVRPVQQDQLARPKIMSFEQWQLSVT